MLTLYEVGRTCRHVVAQVVETKLVVGTEGDVGHVSLATSVGVGTVLVDTVDRESVEHIEWPHPLGVTLGQIVVHGNHVHTVASEGVEENRQCSDEGLTFTRSHLGNLTLVQHRTTEELYVVVNHFPLQVVAACCPVVVVDGIVAIDGNEVVGRIGSQLAVELSSCDYSLLVLCKSAGCIFHDAESCRQHLVEGNLVVVECLFLQLVYLVEDIFTLVDRCVFDSGFQLGNLLSLSLAGVLYILLYFLGFCTKLVIAQGLDVRILGLYFLHDRLDELHVAGRLVAEQ